ncbi:hypothetical protein QYM36_003630 [Artemia franciscana]|uniref:Protein ANTAGONIST OF LIKE HETEROCHROMATIN PROTEIN 1-like n=1 Tax=Artemia franciscana TaxID=6661 RepID=A0AA88L7N2_ARTSF|nr:hypothetical protein QYM36_003630 [Artemia franciscana]
MIVKFRQRIEQKNQMLRDRHGMMATLNKEMEDHYGDKFVQTYQMSEEQFNFNFDLVSPLLHKEDTFMREAIPRKANLALTILCLASGDSMYSLLLLFRISTSTISFVVRETCAEIWESLQPLYMKPPRKEDLKLVVNISVLGIGDARFKLLYVDVGAKGRENDSGIFIRSAFGSALCEGRLLIP